MRTALIFSMLAVFFSTVNLMAGCAQIMGVVNLASDKAAEAVTTYCDNLTVSERQVFGDQVRAKAAPHSIQVTCN